MLLDNLYSGVVHDYGDCHIYILCAGRIQAFLFCFIGYSDSCDGFVDRVVYSVQIGFVEEQTGEVNTAWRYEKFDQFPFSLRFL